MSAARERRRPVARPERIALSYGQRDDLDEVREILERVRLLVTLLRLVDRRDALTLVDTAEEAVLRALRLFDHVLAPPPAQG